MADFRSVVEGLFHISVAQAELDVDKDGNVLLDDLEGDVRALVEKELRKIPALIEVGVDSAEAALERLAKKGEDKVDELADMLAPENDKGQDAPEVDS